MKKPDLEQKCNKLKEELQSLLSDFRHSEQQHLTTSQTVGEHNSSSSWHQGASDAYRKVGERMEDWQQSVNKLVDECVSELKSFRAYRNNIDEALNSGDGTYRP